jgi:tripartite-type tricarboxylate transporter receptor subunit TctC
MTRIQCVALSGAAAALVGILALSATVQAQSVADFYKGRQISIAVVAVGGGYGLNGRLLAEHMGRHIPGSPSLVVVVKSGAGGRTLMNWLYNVAPKDGSTVGFLHKDIAAFSLVQPKGVKYEADKFQWIGSVAPMNTVLFVSKAAPATSIEALRKTQVTMGASGKSHPTALFPQLLNQLLGTKFKVVTGYRGSSDIFLALERGEVGGTTFTWDSVRSAHSEWITENRIVPLVQVSLERDKDLPNIPVLADIMKSAEDKALARFLTSGSKVGRAFGAPPGVPADRVVALRKAFDETVKDPLYKAAIAKTRLPLDPTGGIEVQKLVTEVSNASKPMVMRAQKALGFN